MLLLVWFAEAIPWINPVGAALPGTPVSEECEEAAAVGADLAGLELEQTMDAHLIRGRGQQRAEQIAEEQK